MNARAAALLALLVLAGCGSGGDGESGARLPHALAAELAARSDAVAAKLEASDPCGARAEAEALQERTIAAVNDGRIPPRYRRELRSAVVALVASVECPRAAPPADPPEDEAEDEDEDAEDVDEDDDDGDDGGDDGDEDDDDDEDDNGNGKSDEGKSGGGKKGKDG